ncbi:MAG: hypothetical protein ACI4RP_01825 [Acutalibacteraceae bacterium]
MSDIDTEERPPPHPSADADTFPSRGRLKPDQTSAKTLKLMTFPSRGKSNPVTSKFLI